MKQTEFSLEGEERKKLSITIVESMLYLLYHTPGITVSYTRVYSLYHTPGITVSYTGLYSLYHTPDVTVSYISDHCIIHQALLAVSYTRHHCIIHQALLTVSYTRHRWITMPDVEQWFRSPTGGGAGFIAVMRAGCCFSPLVLDLGARYGLKCEAWVD